MKEPTATNIMARIRYTLLIALVAIVAISHQPLVGQKATLNTDPIYRENVYVMYYPGRDSIVDGIIYVEGEEFRPYEDAKIDTLHEAEVFSKIKYPDLEAIVWINWALRKRYTKEVPEEEQNWLFADYLVDMHICMRISDSTIKVVKAWWPFQRNYLDRLQHRKGDGFFSYF